MGKPVLLWEPCYSLGKKPIVWVVRKARTDILLADLVCFEVQCLPRSAHLKIFLIFDHFDEVVLNLRIHSLQKVFLHQLPLVCLLLCFCLLLLLSIFLHLTKTILLSKALVFPFFLVFRRIGEYISIVLSVLSTSPVVVHSFLRKRKFSFIFMNHMGSCVAY